MSGTDRQTDMQTHGHACTWYNWRVRG